MTKKFLLLIISIFYLYTNAYAFEYGYAPNGFKYVKHKHSESSYQHSYCSANKRLEEYENQD